VVVVVVVIVSVVVVVVVIVSVIVVTSPVPGLSGCVVTLVCTSTSVVTFVVTSALLFVTKIVRIKTMSESINLVVRIDYKGTPNNNVNGSNIHFLFTFDSFFLASLFLVQASFVQFDF